MKFCGMGPTPRDPNMLEDYCFEAINAGQGPKTKVIREIRDERTWAGRTLSMRQAGYRLLRHLQDLLVGLQSGDPERYAQAAREYRHYCEDGHNFCFWDAQAEAGSSPEGHGNDDDDRHFSAEGEARNVSRRSSQPSWSFVSSHTRGQSKPGHPSLLQMWAALSFFRQIISRRRVPSLEPHTQKLQQSSATMRERKTQSMISRTNICSNCTLQCKQASVSSCSCTVIYLLFDSHS